MKKIFLKTNKDHPVIKEYSRAVEKGYRSQHVVPRDNGWAVKRGGASRSTKLFRTQKDAQIYAERIAKNRSVSLFVHGKDGRIRLRKEFYHPLASPALTSQFQPKILSKTP